MPHNIYNSNVEEAVLKSVGPYRVDSADISISGIKRPLTARIITPLHTNTSKTVGYSANRKRTIVIKKQSTSEI